MVTLRRDPQASPGQSPHVHFASSRWRLWEEGEGDSMGTRAGIAARGMEVGQQGNYVKEAGRLGWVFLPEVCEGRVLCLCLGQEGSFVRLGMPEGAPSHTCSEPRHLGALWAKATSAPQKQTKLSFGCSGSCYHGDTEGSFESRGGTGRGLTSVWFKAAGWGWGYMQRGLVGPCQAQHP